ncbi:MAG: DUF2975 domain-containing protein [Chakrabartia sp.]
MNAKPNGTVLKITRGLIYLMMGGAALVGVALSVAAVAAPFYWAEIIAMLVKEKPGVDTADLLPMFFVAFALIIMALGLLWTILKKLLAIIATVANGDPFVRANALRLRAIGWMMVAANVIGIPIGIVATMIADKLGDNDVHNDFSVTGVLAILLVFVLSSVFEQGAAMREDMEGTV